MGLALRFWSAKRRHQNWSAESERLCNNENETAARAVFISVYVGNQHAEWLHRLQQRLMNNYGRDQVTDRPTARWFSSSAWICSLSGPRKWIIYLRRWNSDEIRYMKWRAAFQCAASCITPHTTFSKRQGNRALSSHFRAKPQLENNACLDRVSAASLVSHNYFPSFVSIQHGSGFSLTLLTSGLVDWFVFAGQVVRLKLFVQHWGVCTWQTPRHAKSRFTREPCKQYAKTKFLYKFKLQLIGVHWVSTGVWMKSIKPIKRG